MKEKLTFLYSGVGGIGSSLGSFFSVACPACVPAVGALFSAIGLGFLVNFTLLKWLTLLLLGIGIAGLYVNARKHGKKRYLFVGLLASFSVFSARYIGEYSPMLYGGAGVLLINAVMDYKMTKKSSCYTRS